MARIIDSIGVQKQLNQMFEQRVELENRVLDAMQQELKTAMQLKAVLDGVSAKELGDRLAVGAKAFEELADKAKASGDVGVQAMQNVAKGVKAAAGETSRAGKAFSGLTSVLGSIVTTAGGVAGSMLKIGKAVLSIPLGIFKNLMADAAAAGGDTSFLQALEDVRKEFGSFKESVSKNIMGAFTTVNTQLQQVSGLSVWQVFDKPADQIKYLQEVASKAGAQINQFGAELSKSAGFIATYDKGMGIGAENMKSFMNRATVLGTELTTQLASTANYALQLGRDFGISSKTISRSVGEMMKDVKNFGSLTQKEMTVAAVYTKKLGIEMKDILGVVSQFDNFDKAAESAALLSQAFGANVDAFKLMNEQDPAKRVDELRKSLTAAGKSTENMTRQELKLLANTSGLTEEAAKLAFATKNQGVSYDQVEKQASKAETAQMRQADALKLLADNIERVVRSGGQMHGSFFKMFFAGMEHGIKWSVTYTQAMQKVRASLMETFQAGRQVGQELSADKTLGFNRFMINFGETFSPKNVRKVLYGFKAESGQQMTGVVQEMTKVLKGTQTIEGAVANIRTTFKKAIPRETLNGMLEGGKDIMRFLAKGLGSGAHFLAKELTSVLRTLTDFMSNPQAFLKKAGAAADGTKSFGGQLIADFVKSFGDPKVLSELKHGLVDFAKMLAKGAKKVMSDPAVQKLMLEVGGPILLAMLGPGLVRLIPSLLQPLAAPLMRGLLSVAGGALAAATGVALAGAALINVNKKMDMYEQGIDTRFDRTSRKVGAYGASLAQGLTLGLLPDNLSQMLGNQIAKAADAVFEAITEKMGGPFTKKLKGYFSTYIDFLGSVGGLLGAAFSGDSGKITTEAAKVGESLVRLMGAAFEFLTTEFPKLLIKIPAIINTVLGSVLSGLGTAITNFGDRLGPIGFSVKAFGILITGAGEVLKGLGQAFEWIFTKVKDFDLSVLLTQVGIKIKTAIADVMESIGSVSAPLAKFLGISSDSLKNAVEKMRAEVSVANTRLLDDQRKATQDAARQAVEAASAAQLKGAGPGAATPSEQVQQVKLDVDTLVAQKASLEANLKDLKQFAESGVITKISNLIPQSAKALDDFNTKLSASTLTTSVTVTQGVVKSINELNAILGDGNAGAMKLGEKLKRFADGSGLGKSGTYEIKNKGITLKLDLKVVMDAGEVEKAILMRKESIIFDMLDNGALTPENQEKVNRMAAQKGGA